MSVAQSHPHSSNLPKDAGCTAQFAVNMCRFLCCSYYRHRVAGSGGCLCQFFICHVSADLAPHARQNVGLVRLKAVVVHPLTIGPIPSNHETKDGTTGHACVTILSQGGSKPTDLSSACEGVHLESPHALRNAAFGQVDVEHVGLVACVYYRHRVGLIAAATVTVLGLGCVV